MNPMNVINLTLLVGVIITSVVGQLSLLTSSVLNHYQKLSGNQETNESLPLNRNSEQTSQVQDQQECVCTPFNLCKTYVPAPDGYDLIDIRINLGPCQSYLDVCCNDTETVTDTYVPNKTNDTIDCFCVDQHNNNEKTTEIITQSVTSNYNNNNNKYESSESISENPDKFSTSEQNNNYGSTKYTSETPIEVDFEKDKQTSNEHSSEISDKVISSENNNYNGNKYGSSKYTSIAPSDIISENDKQPSSEYPFEESNKVTTESNYNNKYEPSKYTSEAPSEIISEKDKKPSSEYPVEEPNKLNTPENNFNTEYKPTETNSNHHNNHKCGSWNKFGVGFRITNAIDSESQFGEYPSMIAIFKEEVSETGEKKLSYYCGGSLIKKNVVLTAAHCVIKKDPSTLVVRAGEWDLKTDKEIFPHQDRRVLKFVTHKDYYSGGLHNDIALIFVEEPFSPQENIDTICLPEENENYDYTACFSSGWGKTVFYNNYTYVKKTESGNIHEIGQYEVSILKKVELPIVPTDKCVNALRGTRLGPKFILHGSFICAGGEEGRDTCKGDGGSPLMCPSKSDSNYLVQVGIVSWGISCGLADIPAVYVNVASFRNWIDTEIKIHLT